MKKAIIETMMLGFLLLASTIVIMGTVGDDLVVHNKINNLQNLTDNAALAAAKHYVENGLVSKTDAETMAKNLLDKTALGKEVSTGIAFTWTPSTDPEYVTARISNYSHNTFWYKFLQKDSFNLNIQSVAKIVPPLDSESETLAPFGINECGRTDLTLNNNLSFDFKTATTYADNILTTFYPMDPACDFATGNANFADFKNDFNQGEIPTREYDVDEAETECLVQTNFPNDSFVDPKQLHQVLSSHKFTYPLEIDILTFDCGSTDTALILKNILTITIDSLGPLITTGTGSNKTHSFQIHTTIGPIKKVVATSEDPDEETGETEPEVTLIE